MFEVLLERHAERDLARLDHDTWTRVTRALAALADEPRPDGCRKLAGSVSDWRVRVGNCRILYEIDRKARVVRVMRIRHRREAYR